ncbi:MAG: prolyl oligopeptidase family serine peptidase, partial [Gemmatimonadota bacterium]
MNTPADLLRTIAVSTILLLAPALAAGQGTLADYARADNLNTRLSALITGEPSAATWLGTSSRFWYSVSVAGGHEFRLVDATSAAQRPLFDHARLATALSAAAGESYTAVTLPLTGNAARLEVSDDGNGIRFVLEDDWWDCNLSSYACTRGEEAEPLRGGGAAAAAPEEEEQGDIRTSPDGKWEALIQNYNVAIRPAGSGSAAGGGARGGDDGELIMLSRDGSEGDYYMLGSLRWSPDSRRLMAYHRRPGYDRQVHFVRSSPDDQVQPRLETTRSLNEQNPVYRKPGDVVDRDQPVLFDIASRRQIVIDNMLFPNAYELLAPHWRDDSRAFTFEYNERGHMNYRVIEVDATTGAARAIVDEDPQTFFYYRESSNQGKKFRFDVADGREIVWMSERDGWNHLYLYDGVTGRVKNQITKGEWVVRDVDSVDVANRHVYFEARGMNRDQDPYLVHHYRINFDGTGLVAYTDADGNHTVSWSPDRRFYVDTWSRVDQPHVMQLRRTNDRSVVMEVARTDISRLAASGWQQPEPFVAKGRDGTTDIWGVIIRPTNFDPDVTYPVIEYIYAGPQNSFVPKNFGIQGGMQTLAELGFIVVQIDGMGTNNRSKAFHDVAWKNLGDAGFPDRILWHQAVSRKYSYYDISRVGIYGTSAGGQNSTGALLFHPEFYDVAVSAVGCHDNRMDKISWNETWMSWPIGPHYGEASNVDNAHKLQGNLLLIVGELDTNVDPASTYQVVDALLDASKDVDLLVVPGAGHGSGGAVGTRKRNDYFVRYLHGVEPPRWNALPSVASDVPAETPDPSDDPHTWIEQPPSETVPVTNAW